MKEEQTSKKFQSGNVILIAASHMLHDIYSSFLAPLRPLLIEKFGVSLALASIWDLIMRIPWFLNPLIGIIAEKTAARYFVIVAPAITAIAMSLLGIAPSFTIICVLLFTMGISSAVFHVPSPTMVKRLSGKQTGRGMSYYMFGGELARTAGPLIITASVSYWGLAGTWKLIPFGLTASFILFFKLKNIKISNEIKNKKSEKGEILLALKKYLPFFSVLIGFTIFRAVMKSSLTAFLPTFFYSERGETLWFANSALAVFQLAGAAGTILSGSISDRIGRVNTLLIISIISPFIMLLFIQSQNWLSLVFLIILGFFVFAPGPVLIALVQDRSKEFPVFMNSIYMTVNFVSAALAVFFAGAMGDWLGLEKTYFIASILALGAIPFVLWLKKK
ncbi:MFS transporter [Saccharicrinis fermentans]|uniref:Fosmidomycin resistance protein n=1 Tax=Saccharicrinis fermentans DSM 9555 = JCM 21142 TaxID=869213 RepID=W7YTC2_9BACT|nr:MFS transporter [Saccharicrinis fermentans]GAF05684.1 fosmidomycin resistance protein [Saccharicrinis fermentans DSM 9555 = JCM 21142]